MSQTGVMDGHQNVLALPQAPDAIELRHLRAFVAVADDLSFSRAAQRLFISQPALSRQIRGLERLVGCDLFRRSTQRVELTLAGEALLARHATQCGVEARITVYPVPTHAFHIFWNFLPEAREAVDDAGRFIRALAGPPKDAASGQHGQVTS